MTQNSLIITVIYGLLGLGIALSLVKLLRVPLLSTKTVVLDVITTIITAVLLFSSHIFKSSMILDIAIIYAILSFAAVLLIARYMEKGL